VTALVQALAGDFPQHSLVEHVESRHTVGVLSVGAATSASLSCSPARACARGAGAIQLYHPGAGAEVPGCTGVGIPTAV
jgi:hypothetical protein